MKTKINHPYHVPEGFFDDFRKSMENEIEKLQTGSGKKVKFHYPKWMKYAAIFLFLVGAGYASFRLINQPDNMIDENLQLTVEEILPQISEEELTDYVIENITPEKFEQLKFE